MKITNLSSATVRSRVGAKMGQYPLSVNPEKCKRGARHAAPGRNYNTRLSPPKNKKYERMGYGSSYEKKSATRFLAQSRGQKKNTEQGGRVEQNQDNKSKTQVFGPRRREGTHIPGKNRLHSQERKKTWQLFRSAGKMLLQQLVTQPLIGRPKARENSKRNQKGPGRRTPSKNLL